HAVSSSLSRTTLFRSVFANKPVDLPMSVLFGKPPKMHRQVERKTFAKPMFDASGIDLSEAAERVLRLPTVASKSFLITIGDRSIDRKSTRLNSSHVKI